MSDKPSPPKTRKRRWLRYSLRTLLLLTAVGIGWLANHPQRHAVQWVEDMGGSASYDPVWLCNLIGIDSFADVKVVRLENTDVRDLTPLSGLGGGVQVLHLSDTSVSDLTPLSGLGNLRWLSLSGTPATDLTPLVEMKKVSIHLHKSQKMTVPTELESRIIRRDDP